MLLSDLVHKESETSVPSAKTSRSRTAKEKKSAKKEKRSSSKQELEGGGLELQFMSADEVSKLELWHNMGCH